MTRNRVTDKQELVKMLLLNSLYQMARGNEYLVRSHHCHLTVNNFSKAFGYF